MIAVSGCAALPRRHSTASRSNTTGAETTTPHWDYDAEGPERWAELDSHFATCGSGHAQSPVDLPGHTQLHPDDHTVIGYSVSPSATIVHNGHTLQATMPGPAANRILLGDRVFPLIQFHFHIPGEHTVDGADSTMELHLVHRDDTGALAVLGVLLHEATGPCAFDSLLAELSQHQGASVTTAPVDLHAFLPADRGQFRYDGSLTTPPCSEGVSWTVLRTPVPISTAVVDRYHALFPHSNRPTQPLNGRAVAVTDH